MQRENDQQKIQWQDHPDKTDSVEKSSQSK